MVAYYPLIMAGMKVYPIYIFSFSTKKHIVMTFYYTISDE
ncbi:hypothetical protein PTUN_a0353 [Pseudoalteromonas tunicata]|nr:hypothetical protein PTUN_a0353 [Pseudoalteromonas tunicata]